jgi:hypothetical protein
MTNPFARLRITTRTTLVTIALIGASIAAVSSSGKTPACARRRW